MRKFNRIITIFIITTLCFALLACSKKEDDFDASGYVKASLDAAFHREYAEYAKFLDISEKEAKKTDDGDYIVKVQVEPSDVYQTLEQSSTEVSNEKIEQGLEPTDPFCIFAFSIKSKVYF